MAWLQVHFEAELGEHSHSLLGTALLKGEYLPVQWSFTGAIIFFWVPVFGPLHWPMYAQKLVIRAVRERHCQLGCACAPQFKTANRQVGALYCRSDSACVFCDKSLLVVFTVELKFSFRSTLNQHFRLHLWNSGLGVPKRKSVLCITILRKFWLVEMPVTWLIVWPGFPPPGFICTRSLEWGFVYIRVNTFVTYSAVFHKCTFF